MNKIKVHIDDQPLKNESAFRGVGEYTRNLIEALGKQKNLILVQKDEDSDVVHYPYFDLFFLILPFFKKRPTVVTIHDVTPLIFPEHYPPGMRGNLKFKIQRFSLKSTEAVITDSVSSKKDIVKYLGFPEEKTFVIYLAPRKEFGRLATGNWQLAIREKYKLPDRFVLYVGDVNYNKNILGLVRAFAKTQRFKDSKIQRSGMVLVGKAFENRELPEVRVILQLIEELGLVNEVKVLGFVPTKDLVGIYNCATVYCQPSFYEGFGLPVLEAMACGCPVVAANTASLPEICGDAAVMVNPNDIGSIADGLKKLIRDENLRRDLTEKGLEQAQKFSWEKAAGETVKVYERILREK